VSQELSAIVRRRYHVRRVVRFCGTINLSRMDAPERSSFCGPRLSLPLGFDVKSMHFRRRLHHAFVR